MHLCDLSVVITYLMFSFSLADAEALCTHNGSTTLIWSFLTALSPLVMLDMLWDLKSAAKLVFYPYMEKKMHEF